MKVLASILAAVVVAATAGTSFAGGVIRLHKQALVEQGPVRVGDVALLTGVEGGEKLSEVVVLAEVGGGGRVRAEDILFAIAAQRGAGMVKDLAVTGASECVVLAGRETANANRALGAAETRVETKAGATAAAAIPQGKAPASVSKAGTLGGLLKERVCQELETPAEDVRVDFETISPWLDTAVGANQRWQFRPLIKGGIGTLQWEAQLLEGSRVAAKLTVMAKVTRRQRVLLATGAITRGDVLGASAVREDDAWLDRKLPTLAGKPADVLGLEALRGVSAGAMLDTRDFKPAEMATRDETITVYAVSGSLLVKGSAKATEVGKMHDSIRVKNAATGELYTVRLIGKRVAVAGGELDEATEKKLREMP